MALLCSAVAAAHRLCRLSLGSARWPQLLPTRERAPAPTQAPTTPRAADKPVHRGTGPLDAQHCCCLGTWQQRAPESTQAVTCLLYTSPSPRD
eukprot:3427318-Alexandrium_andersonii.AAC.1